MHTATYRKAHYRGTGSLIVGSLFAILAVLVTVGMLVSTQRSVDRTQVETQASWAKSTGVVVGPITSCGGYHCAQVRTTVDGTTVIREMRMPTVHEGHLTRTGDTVTAYTRNGHTTVIRVHAPMTVAQTAASMMALLLFMAVIVGGFFGFLYLFTISH